MIAGFPGGTCTKLSSYSGCLLLHIMNSAHVHTHRHGTDTHHRKQMPCDRYPLLCDATALHGNGPIRGHNENTAPVLLAARVLRALPSS
jgi:hypothetical protein